MEKLSVIHSTFVIERSYPTSPERVFAAFAAPAKKRRWFAEGGSSEPREFEMDFRVGGSEHSRGKMQDGTPLANDTSYQDIEPNRRIVFAYTMSVGEGASRRLCRRLNCWPRTRVRTLFTRSRQLFLKALMVRRSARRAGVRCLNNSQKSWRGNERLL